MEEDPLEALYAEFADAINYTFAAADPNRLGGRQIEALGHIRNGLRAWAYAVELIYATAPVYVPTEAKFHKE
jgi:hypothetical protein